LGYKRKGIVVTKIYQAIDRRLERGAIHKVRIVMIAVTSGEGELQEQAGYCRFGGVCGDIEQD
jgi:uncharacterized protein YjaZ